MLKRSVYVLQQLLTSGTSKFGIKKELARSMFM